MITWREMNATLNVRTEAEVLALLNEERAGAKRVVITERLHQRYCALRAARERVELLTEAMLQK